MLKTPLRSHRLRPGGRLFTFCEEGCLGCVRQAELALLPAAVVADQGVVGLFDVHVIANAEDVTGSLDAQRPSKQKKVRLLTTPFSTTLKERHD